MKLFILVLIFFYGMTVIAGDISGTVHIQGTADNADAVVYVENTNNIKFNPPKAQPVMDQQHLTFVPHVLPIVVGTTVQFKNSDKVAHNIFTPSPAGDMFNLGTWKGDQIKTHTFTKTGEVVLLCNLHPEMEGFIYVVPTPYFMKTNIEGNFTITDVPAGNYTINIWSEHGNARPQKVNVPKKGETMIHFNIK